jgi:citrate/tricarballylate utilization protein
MSTNDNLIEARRQIEICNACRYCEGFCAVFPAMTRNRTFALADMTQLANLCHNCQGCYHACQYTAPHEFAINLPAVLADARTESWERFAAPSAVARVVQRHGVWTLLLLVLGLTLALLASAGVQGAPNFYGYFSHNVLVALFTPLFLGALAMVVVALRRYWAEVGGERVRWSDLKSALAAAATLRNLSGGQGQGCQYEDEDRYSQRRRWAHQAVMYGFLLCFASTSVATVMHYLLNLPAPYAWYSLPKLLGVPGGLLLSLGCVELMRLKARSDPKLGSASRWGGDWAFIGALMIAGASGLALYAATGSAWVRPTLAVHLASVATLFVLLPYSKMVHGFFRLAALVREAQLDRTSA